jgi:hypothetical protein
MFYALDSSGWHQDGDFNIGREDCLTVNFVHKKYDYVGLDITITFAEFPAITTISLLGSDGIVDQEWCDEEIDVDDITRCAKALNLEEIKDKEGEEF